MEFNFNRESIIYLHVKSIWNLKDISILATMNNAKRAYFQSLKSKSEDITSIKK